jgi:aerobic C4-dicarboxylate transport protein
MVALEPVNEDTPRRATPWYRQLYAQVLIAIVAGICVGYFSPETGVALQPLGDAFIKLIKMSSRQSYF